MEKICPRCKYPQEGMDQCEYCGLVFAQYKKAQDPKKTSLLTIIFSLIAIIGFLGLVYYLYQYESAKKMAELEKISKPKVSQRKKTEKPQEAKNISKQQDPEKDEKKAIIPEKKVQKTIPVAPPSEQQNIETENKKAVSTVNKNQKAASAVITKVFCSRFKVNTVLKGKELEFWLDTDLPYDTIVMVSVSRLYWIKDNPGTYSGSYHGKRSSVLELRKPVSVIIDDNEWRRQIETKHKLIDPTNEPLQVSKISDNIELNLTVPINQDNPAFGRRNVNLEGTMVIANEGFRIIREEKMFLVPFRDAISTLTPANTTWQPSVQTQ
jgi:hypothetical protein